MGPPPTGQRTGEQRGAETSILVIGTLVHLLGENEASNTERLIGISDSTVCESNRIKHSAITLFTSVL